MPKGQLICIKDNFISLRVAYFEKNITQNLSRNLISQKCPVKLKYRYFVAET